MNELLRDAPFLEGFRVVRRKEDKEGVEFLMPFYKKEPEWRICEWCTRDSLFASRSVIEKEKSYVIFNAHKRVERDEDGRLTLAIVTKDEYLHPRLDGEGWPHLLIEQSYERENIKNLSKLLLDFDLSFLSFESHMGEERNDLHTLQVSLYLAIGDTNPESKGYHDFYWLGVPLIDYPRYLKPRGWINQDLGKDDATKKLIYAVDPNSYLKSPFLPGDNLHFKLDLLPFLLEAYKEAKRRGFLPCTKVDDLGVLSLNFGFEATGEFDGKLRINRFSILKEEYQ